MCKIAQYSDPTFLALDVAIDFSIVAPLHVRGKYEAKKA